jgi:hypothetical protein
MPHNNDTGPHYWFRFGSLPLVLLVRLISGPGRHSSADITHDYRHGQPRDHTVRSPTTTSRREWLSIRDDTKQQRHLHHQRSRVSATGDHNRSPRRFPLHPPHRAHLLPHGPLCGNIPGTDIPEDDTRVEDGSGRLFHHSGLRTSTLSPPPPFICPY